MPTTPPPWGAKCGELEDVYIDDYHIPFSRFPIGNYNLTPDIISLLTILEP